MGNASSAPTAITDRLYGKLSSSMNAAAPAPTPFTEDPGRWAALLKIAIAILLAMSLWFSASAVSPALRAEWSLNPENNAGRRRRACGA